MKKILLLLSALAACFFGQVQTTRAQDSYDPSASREIFDFSPFGESAILSLFYNAQQAGREYPTREEFEAAGFSMTDLEFARSHVRPHALIDDQDNQLVDGVKGLVDADGAAVVLRAALAAGPCDIRAASAVEAELVTTR